MASTHSDDARAAARLARIPNQSTAPSSQVRRGLVDEDGWTALSQQIVQAASVQAVGVMPEVLIEAIRREIEADTRTSLPEFEYFTPLPEMTLNIGKHHHRHASRWQAGYLGLRNLVMAAREHGPIEDPSDRGYRHFGNGVPALSFNCLICVKTTTGQEDAFLLTELLEDAASPRFFLYSLASADPQLASYVADIRRNSTPIRLREVRCHEGDSAAPSDELIHKLKIGELVPLGGTVRAPNVMRPIAIIVVRAHGPSGLEIILKRRTPLTDTDDFGKLSLLSARVQEVDLAGALHTSMSPSSENDDVALDDLWLAASSPTPFYLPLDAFKIAAQRELFITLGLHFDISRFINKGLQLVSHESSSVQQMAFVVFTLDLLRAGDVDELRAITKRNPVNLVRIPVGDVYSDEGRLNRLLRQRKRWLIDTCFVD